MKLFKSTRDADTDPRVFINFGFTDWGKWKLCEGKLGRGGEGRGRGGVWWLSVKEGRKGGWPRFQGKGGFSANGAGRSTA